MESSEETPLLLSANNLDHEQVYQRFSLARKRGILAIVSLVALIPRMYYLSSISQVESSDTELIVSFCVRDFRSFYTPNRQRPRFDRTCRRVNTLACRRLMILTPQRLTFQACREHFNIWFIIGRNRRLVLFHFL